MTAHWERSAASRAGGGNGTLQSSVTQLFADLYEQCIDYREGIVRVLLDNIYASRSYKPSNHRAKPEPRGHNRHITSQLGCPTHVTRVPSVRELLGNKLLLGNRFVKNVTTSSVSSLLSFSSPDSHIRALAQQSTLILERIVTDHPVVVSTIVSSLVERIQSPTTGTALREQKGLMVLDLPCPVVLYRIIMMIVHSISAQPTIENTLLIIAQKLVGGFSIPDEFVMTVFCGMTDGVSRQPVSSRLIDGERQGARIRRLGHGIGDLDSPSCDYTAGAMGMIIAGAILKRLLEHSDVCSSSTFALQDMTAIFGWVQRTIVSSRNVSVAYALDALSLLARSM